MINRLSILGLALTGGVLAVSAYFIRHNVRREAARQNKEDLRTWESEGGTPAPVTAPPVHASRAAC